ncbi:VOC family protein [Polymorphobacter arshaanensis]|uniref:VOC family protein n=1 Tax=Glacieibacterium arshaanense TaxID=2511025 RepID=A0A4Y9ERL7_9SPHN|nr:VOC family protein [Polymorphobacter arshaanensis]TFU05990.1 VOC family protein [Polymorphobacter arshaanensis]
MTSTHGKFIWYELLTSDPAAAARFYAQVIGWSASAPADHGGYGHFAADGEQVAGLMALPNGAPMPAGWLGYICVDDVDATLAAITAAGGTIHMPANDIPGTGRIAMVADPQGGVFYVMTPKGVGASTSFSMELLQRCSWNELSTTDQNGALAFYQGLFGWTQGDAMDMGALGQYRFINRADGGIGAVTPCPPGGPPTVWTYYFRVPDIDAAVARVIAAGGSIAHGPSAVPGDDHIIIGTDPQGASFALVGKRAAA